MDQSKILSSGNELILNRPTNSCTETNERIYIREENNSSSKMMISVFDRVENIVGTGENAGLHSFLPTMFSSAYFVQGT